MKRERATYTIPVVVRGADGDWFVFFRYWNETTGKMQAIKLREGLNKIHDKKEKEAEFKALREARETWLKMGWNPITDTFPTLPAAGFEQLELDLASLQKMSFTEALDYAFKMKYNDWAHKSRQDYGSKIKYLKEGAIRIGISLTGITALKRLHFRALLENVRQTRKLTAAGYNTYKDYLSALVGELEANDILEYNPVSKIKPKDTIKVKAHRPPTKDEQTLIINRIRGQHRPYYRFLAILFGCALRPKEICGLKIKHLHRKEQIFRLTPDSEGSTKTKTEREPSIPNWCMDVLAELNLHKFHPDFYIFSTFGGNEDRTFLPGPNRMHSNTPTRWWRKIVKDPVSEGGLGLNVTQYALKKLAGDEMVRLQRREQLDKLLELPREQMGHTTTGMTEVYTDEHLVIMRELWKEKAPEL